MKLRTQTRRMLLNRYRDSWFYGLRIHKNDFNLKFEIFFDILFWTLLQIGYEWKLIALLLKKKRKWEPFLL